jgi:hypothetical protein
MASAFMPLGLVAGCAPLRIPTASSLYTAPSPPRSVEHVDPVAGGAAAANGGAALDRRQSMAEDSEPSTALDDTLKCAFCFDLCVRPVTVRTCSAGLVCQISRYSASEMCDACRRTQSMVPSQLLQLPNVGFTMPVASMHSQGCAKQLSGSPGDRRSNCEQSYWLLR